MRMQTNKPTTDVPTEYIHTALVTHPFPLDQGDHGDATPEKGVVGVVLVTRQQPVLSFLLFCTFHGFTEYVHLQAFWGLHPKTLGGGGCRPAPSAQYLVGSS